MTEQERGGKIEAGNRDRSFLALAEEFCPNVGTEFCVSGRCPKLWKCSVNFQQTEKLFPRKSPEESAELRGTILAKSKEEFSYKLSNFLHGPILAEAFGDIGIVAVIQFAEVDSDILEDLMDRYCYEGGMPFAKREETLEQLRTFSRQVSVSYVPKDFGNYHPCEKDFTKKFGWVNFTVFNPLEIRPK